MTVIEIALLILFSIFFIFVGFFLKTFILIKKKNFIEIEIKEKKLIAEKEIENIKQEARKKIDQREDEIFHKEKTLLEKDNFLLEERKKIDQKFDSFFEERKKIENTEKKIEKELEELSGINKYQALDILQKKVEENNKQDLFLQMRRLETSSKEKIEKKSKEILAIAIQKFSKNIENNLVTSSIKILEEDKGKVIGKDGRNIKCFESETGVQLLVDQTDGEIVISSFDPIRREVAAIALEKLLIDGIINPAKIEEFVIDSKSKVIEKMEEMGKRAAEEVGLYNIPKEILDILGRLHYRTSYGQNVLKHSIEMAHISEVIAEELGADVYVAKAGALFHDIGKAVNFETKGTHVEIGRKILKKHGIDQEIIKAMQSHHKEYSNENLESYIVDAADAISGARPGARNDNADMYIKKLEGLEKITKEFDGVLNAYALSAGREIRVFVKPDEIDDFNAAKMARDIALRIEEELKYPGEIKIALIREQRIIEFAR